MSLRVYQYVCAIIRRAGIALLLGIAAAPCGYSDRAGRILEDAPDVDLLALVIWNEARGEPAAAKVLIAETVLERVRDERWPDTIEGVLTQAGQFQNFNVSAQPSPWAKGWKECVRAARAALRGGPSAANHFHSIHVRPAWHDPSKVVLRYGGHVFLRL